jgi:hypothetical protein
MTPRTFWDRYGHLWEKAPHFDVMRTVWRPEDDGGLTGWWMTEDVKNLCGPLVASC